MINDLFENNPEQAERLRDEGITRSLNTATLHDWSWNLVASEALIEYVSTHSGPFMIEDVREWARKVPVPPSNRAWGAVVLQAARNGLIKKVGYGVTMNPRSHRTPATMWMAV